MSQQRVYVTFSVKSDRLSAQQLAAAMAPLYGRTQASGEPLSPRDGAKLAEFASWEFSTRPTSCGQKELPDETAPISAHLDCVISKLAGKGEVLEALAVDCDIEVICFVSTNASNCWFDVPFDTINSLAKLQADLVFDIYTC